MRIVFSFHAKYLNLHLNGLSVRYNDTTVQYIVFNFMLFHGYFSLTVGRSWRFKSFKCALHCLSLAIKWCQYKRMTEWYRIKIPFNVKFTNEYAYRIINRNWTFNVYKVQRSKTILFCIRHFMISHNASFNILFIGTGFGAQNRNRQKNGSWWYHSCWVIVAIWECQEKASFLKWILIWNLIIRRQISYVFLLVNYAV